MCTLWSFSVFGKWSNFFFPLHKKQCPHQCQCWWYFGKQERNVSEMIKVFGLPYIERQQFFRYWDLTCAGGPKTHASNCFLSLGEFYCLRCLYWRSWRIGNLNSKNILADKSIPDRYLLDNIILVGGSEYFPSCFVINYENFNEEVDIHYFCFEKETKSQNFTNNYQTIFYGEFS